MTPVTTYHEKLSLRITRPNVLQYPSLFLLSPRISGFQSYNTARLPIIATLNSAFAPTALMTAPINCGTFKDANSNLVLHSLVSAVTFFGADAAMLKLNDAQNQDTVAKLYTVKLRNLRVLQV